MIEIMANTYSNLFYHFVFSTKNREKFIGSEIENRVWAYIGGIARKHGVTGLQIGGIENHVHALIVSPPAIAPSKIAQFLKGESSKWIHEEFPDLRKFAWQDGYGVFSVSKTSASGVIGYIKNQRQHHLEKSFEDEYIEMLNLQEVDYDDKYVFG
jgi:putative transposase